MLRVARVFKLVNKWKALHDAIAVTGSTIGDIANFLILLALLVFTYAIIGMELFANKIKFDSNDLVDLEKGTSPRFNYDNLQNALIATYTLVIGDSWVEHLFHCSRINYAVGAIYIYTAVYILNVFFVGLFVAILLQSFFVDEQKKIIEEEEKKNKDYEEEMKRAKSSTPNNKYQHRERTLLTALKIFGTVVNLNKMCKERSKRKSMFLKGASLYIFGEDSNIRYISAVVVKSSVYEFIVYVMVIINSVVITFRTPLNDPNGKWILTANIVDIFLAIFFGLEILMKLVTYGAMMNGPKSYLHNPWNVLDTVTTIALILELAMQDKSRIADIIITLFRALRVLRIVTIGEIFRLSISAIGRGLPDIVQIIGVSALFCFIFSIAGIHFFKGSMYFCNRDYSELSEEIEIDSIYDCLNYGGDWVSRDVSFDNIFVSMMTLFEILTGKCWWVTLIGLADNYEIDKEPKNYSNYNRIWFVVAYSIIGFLAIRAFITGLINFVFSKAKEDLQGVANLDPGQRKWVNLSKVIFKAAPIRIVR